MDARADTRSDPPHVDHLHADHSLGVDLRMIEEAARRIAPFAVRTPLLRSPALDAIVGATVLLKAEPLQRTGSFKLRGAYNRIAQLPDEVRARGVIAFSSGNHGQAVAASAKHFGVPATVVMPADAPAIKVELTRSHGAEVVFYDRWSGDRAAIAREIASRTGATVVPPYDDRDVIAGQGTIGLEIAQQTAELGLAPDVVFCCCGGGGLIAGLATAMSHAAPNAAIYAVEPAGFDDTARSLEAGERLSNAPGGSSICDAIVTPTPGALTFPINRRLLAGGVSVTDDEVRRAVAFACGMLKLVVEPGGAVALAAVLAQKIDIRGKTVVAVLSGGNIEPAMLAEIVAGRSVGAAQASSSPMR